jgi:type IV pilus assembly protein PilZ
MDVQTTQVGPSVELRVNYRRLNTFFADYVKSISRGGTFIATQRPLPIGTCLACRASTPPWS